MKNDLSPMMQERLEKWMKNTLPVKSAEIFKRKPEVRRQIFGDYGDDIRDFEAKRQSAFNEQNQEDVMKDDYE